MSTVAGLEQVMLWKFLPKFGAMLKNQFFYAQNYAFKIKSMFKS